MGVDYLVPWTDRVMIAVTAGRSSAEMVRTSGGSRSAPPDWSYLADRRTTLRTERTDKLSSGTAGFEPIPISWRGWTRGGRTYSRNPWDESQSRRCRARRSYGDLRSRWDSRRSRADRGRGTGYSRRVAYQATRAGAGRRENHSRNNQKNQKTTSRSPPNQSSSWQTKKRSQNNHKSWKTKRVAHRAPCRQLVDEEALPEQSPRTTREDDESAHRPTRAAAGKRRSTPRTTTKSWKTKESLTAHPEQRWSTKRPLPEQPEQLGRRRVAHRPTRAASSWQTKKHSPSKRGRPRVASTSAHPEQLVDEEARPEQPQELEDQGVDHRPASTTRRQRVDHRHD